jgi:DNA polymerase-1
MDNTKQRTIVLVDANALVHRAFHAFPTSLVTSKGELTNAAYGFTTLLLEVLAKFEPMYVVCCFDTAKPTLRHLEYKDYKAHRKPMDPLLSQQFPRVHEVLDALNIPVFAKDGYEADDLIGTLARSGELADLAKVIVTGDQDILQLVEDELRVAVYMAGSSFSQSKLYTENEVQERYNFAPPQIIDYKAILGDPSDNIPGVAGIGKKGATDLVAKFTTVERMYESLEAGEELWQEQPFKRLANKLIAGKESAFFSQKLATIDTKVDLDFDLESARLASYDMEKAKAKFQELEFRTLVTKLPALAAADKPKGAKQTDAGDGPEQLAMLGNTEEVDYQVLGSTEECVAVLEKVLQAKVVSLDTESDKLDQIAAQMLGIGLSTGPQTGYYLPAEHLDEHAKQLVQQLLDKGSQGEITLVAHNLKYDLHILATWGLKIPDTSKYFDTLIASFLLQAGEGGLGTRGLKDLAFSHLGMVMTTLDDLLGRGKNKKEMRDLELQVLGEYCCSDVDATIRLYQLFSVQLEANQYLEKLFKQIEMPLVKVLIEIERRGIYLDMQKLAELTEEARNLLAETQQDIYKTVGREFNIGSPRQVGDILFGELKIHEGSKIPVSKTKTGSYSTDERTLMNFAKDNEIVSKIMSYRELSKLISTYYEGLVKVVSPEGKLHTNYNQTVAATGRLSSQNPNLQNIPISSEIGRRIRLAFKPGEGRCFWAFDYAQQELRLLAHFSGEDKLKEAFANDLDVHSVTASEILDVPLAEVSKDQRRIGKTVNFGVIYGISAFGLADRLKIDHATAQQFIKAFFENYPKVAEYFKQVKQQALTAGEIYTILGRKRDARAFNTSNMRVRAAIERELINFPLQGSAADIMKLAMLRLNSDQELAPYWGKELQLHLQIHDELLFSLPKKIEESVLQKVIARIVKVMSGCIELSVPLEVDSETGDNWYEMEPAK